MHVRQCRMRNAESQNLFNLKLFRKHRTLDGQRNRYLAGEVEAKLKVKVEDHPKSCDLVYLSQLSRKRMEHFLA